VILIPHTYAAIDPGNKQITLSGTYLRFIKIPLVLTLCIFVQGLQNPNIWKI
jgi:hypothetical protein